MRTLVISLSNATERRRHIQQEFCNTRIARDISFFNGIDGSLLEITEIFKNRIFQVKTEDDTYFYDSQLRLNGEGLKRGDIGCTLSHITVYKLLVIDKDHDRYLVFEDDVKFNVEDAIVKEFLERLPNSKDYDIAHLCESDWFPFMKDSEENSHYFRPVKNFFNRLTAYVVTKRGAHKLLASSYPLIGLPADDLVSNTFVFSKDFKVIYPNHNVPLFINHPDIKSKTEEINKK